MPKRARPTRAVQPPDRINPTAEVIAKATASYEGKRARLGISKISSSAAAAPASGIDLDASVALHNGINPKKKLDQAQLELIKQAIAADDEERLVNALCGYDLNDWGALSLGKRKQHKDFITYTYQVDSGWHRKLLPILFAFGAKGPEEQAQEQAAAASAAAAAMAIAPAVNVTVSATVTLSDLVTTDTAEIIANFTAKQKHFAAECNHLEQQVNSFTRLMMRKEFFAERLWSHLRINRMHSGFGAEYFYLDFFAKYFYSSLEKYQEYTNRCLNAESKVHKLIRKIAALKPGFDANEITHAVDFSNYRDTITYFTIADEDSAGFDANVDALYAYLKDYLRCCIQIEQMERFLAAGIERYDHALQDVRTAYAAISTFSLKQHVKEQRKVINLVMCRLGRELYALDKYFDQFPAQFATSSASAGARTGTPASTSSSPDPRPGSAGSIGLTQQAHQILSSVAMTVQFQQYAAAPSSYTVAASSSSAAPPTQRTWHQPRLPVGRP